MRRKVGARKGKLGNNGNPDLTVKNGETAWDFGKEQGGKPGV